MIRSRFPMTALAVAFLAAPVFAADAETTSFDPWSDGARYEFTYRVDLAQIAARPDDEVRLWVPLPARTPDQRVLEGSVEAPYDVTEGQDALGNRMASLSWQGAAEPDASAEWTFVIERLPSHGVPADAVMAGTPDDPTRYLEPTSKVPLDGLIEQIAVQESRGLQSDAERIRAFYDYVTKTMRYSKEGEGWGQGDAIWACTSKYGNCTDFHSLFLGMARSQSIPARFWIGFPVPPGQVASEIGGYHCWAEAWDPARGWVPFDASEAWKAKRFDDYFGTLPSDRVVFTAGRDLVLEPAQSGPPLNFFIYPYVERNGEPVEGVKGSFSFRRIAAPIAQR